MELDVVEKEKWLGEVIAQLQHEKIILNALVYPEKPPEQVVEWKGAIEEIVVQFEEMEQDAKNITEVTMQFWCSVLQDE